MNKICLLLCCLLPGLFRAGAQELKMTECAPLTQIYGEVSESDELLPMGDVGVEFGYVLYQAAITVPAGEAALELENVRDYAAVYLDGVFQGTLTDNRKTLVLKAETGQHTLQLYVENIGRITYGPEILDNSKGLFGEARLAGETQRGIVPTMGINATILDADPTTVYGQHVIKKVKPLMERVKSHLNMAYEHGGVLIGWGTDAPISAYQKCPGLEFRMRKEFLGWDNLEILKQATINSAKLCRIDDEVGTIKVGKCADVILVDGDPVKDITVMYQAAAHVFRGGEQYK